MQPDGPYRYTHLLGGSPVGKAWAALDQQGRFVTVAVLDATVAAAPGWREAFAGIVNHLAQTPGGTPFVYADFSAAAPWVAYGPEAGPAAEKLFRALNVEYTPAPTSGPPVSAPPTPEPSPAVPQQFPAPAQPTSGVPASVSGAPASVSGMPQSPTPVGPTSFPGQQAPFLAYPVSGSPVPAPDSAPPSGALVSAFPSTPNEPAPADPFAAPARRIKPSETRRSPVGLLVGIAALVLVVLAAAGGLFVWVGSTGSDKATPPPYTHEERAVAIAAPALVYVEVVVTGYLRDKSSGTPLRAAPVTFKRRCSGFVVQADGHAFTNGLCVRPAADTARQNALYSLGRTLIEEGELDSADLDDFVAKRLNATVLGGVGADQEPEVRLFGQFNVAKGNVTESPAIPGEIVRTWEPELGNVALVKFAKQDLPVAELNAAADVQQGASLFTLGYATSERDPLTASYAIASKPVTVLGSGSVGAVSGYRVTDDVGIHSRGGMVIDSGGRVAGILDNDRELPDGANRAVVPAATLAGMLTDAGVSNALGPVDTGYRSGLDAYFGGRYADAIAHFDAVPDDSPAKLIAQDYRQKAADRQQIEGQGGGSARTVGLVAALGGALVGALILFLIMVARRRMR
ncbi:hypothetical protein GCM10009541_52540 [Micromonospora gifhornensis]|uniref:Trypsin-like peptidase domain-containing protein n=1 Tax=Micromonospora gifhornensis TaxID=84594 RepID=A0ABQ4IGE6_9ACTN|nr:trypsin-like peptidase domain-containing protein [Micromonospora gifhornensis]GIJ16979.1 hypothetical protein Vgi01_36630 [Micromonospora gifhornensis]